MLGVGVPTRRSETDDAPASGSDSLTVLDVEFCVGIETRLHLTLNLYFYDQTLHRLQLCVAVCKVL